MGADSNLLFGLLALQVGLIDQAKLVAAFQAWMLDKARPLAEHMTARGDLDSDDRAAVNALVNRHLKRNDGNPEKSLAAIPAARYAGAALAKIGDPDIENTLYHAGVGTTHRGGDDATECGAGTDGTATYSHRSATGDLQRFLILRPHARGGLGAVFVALDTELNREVALKQILDTHADDPISRQRFLLEAKVTGGLEHPGIVPVYGLGSYANGRPFYAMRFVRGESLKDAVDRFYGEPRRVSAGSPREPGRVIAGSPREPGRLSAASPGGHPNTIRGAQATPLAFRQLLRRFVDVCNAIDYAHSRGILHRDIKPATIILGKHGETLVADWGLAKAIGAAETRSGERSLLASATGGSSETLPGSALGTPAYMSPEQAGGDRKRLSARSDVYSLGATLYYVLTGTPPLAADDVGALVSAVQRGEIRRPRAIDPSIDRALEAVCVKAMAFKPEDRYATAQAFADDVERWMAGEPISAWREPLSVRVRRWARRHRTAVTAAAAALLVALAGLAAVLVVQTASKRDLALSNVQLTSANTELRRSFVREGAARVRAQKRFDLAKKAVEAYYTGASEDVLLKQPELEDLRNRLLSTALDFYRELGADLDNDPEAAVDPKAQSELARSNIRVARIIDEVSSISDAERAFRQALAMHRKLAERKPPDVEWRIGMGDCLSRIGWLLLRAGRSDESMRHYLEAQAILQPLVNERSDALGAREDLAWCIGGIASLQARAGHHESARRSREKVLEIREGLVQADPKIVEWQANLAATVHDLGVHAHNLGHTEEALEFYRRALGLKKKLADEHPGLSRLQDELAAVYNDLANAALEQRGGEPEAMRLYCDSLAIREKLVQSHPTVSRFQNRLSMQYYNIGLVLAQRGRWDAATDHF
jgi:serine/threonine-protein kinase